MKPETLPQVTVRDALSATARLANCSDSPELDCQILLADVLGVSRSWLYSHDDITLNVDDMRRFQSMIERRQAGEPVAYITGQRPFWDMTLEVSPATLVPRPETELLVEAVLDSRPDSPLTAIDLGTGSGAIAIALARERCSWQLYASDNSLESLTIAKHNAAQWSADRIIFLCADWLAAFRHQAFDVIVCNPPYIQGGDPHLKDLCHEPASALIANDNGLGDLKRVINASVTAIRPGGHIFLEHGYDQQEIVVDLLVQAGYTTIKPGSDLAGNPRFVSGYYQP